MPTNEKKNTVGNCCETKLNFTKMKKLSREEMKNVLGGIYPPATCSCSCNGQTGSWDYIGQPSGPTLVQDIKDYCNNGAVCSGCTNGVN